MSFLLELVFDVFATLVWRLVRRPLGLLARILGLRWLWGKLRAFGERGSARNGALWPVYVVSVLLILAAIPTVLLVLFLR